MRSHRRLHGEGGASLILALAFLTLVSAFAVSTLTLAGVSFRNTEVTRSKVGEAYAADGGVEWGVAQLTSDDVCGERTDSFHGGIGTFTQQINGKNVTVQCKTTAVDEHTETIGGGGSPLLGGYTAILGSNNSGGITINGSQNQGPAFLLGGKVYAQGTVAVTDAQLSIEGDLELRSQACTPPGVVFPNGNPCASGKPVPNVPNPIPAVKIPPNALGSKSVGGCTILYPGKYQSKPTFSSGKRYYLASGTYYFNNVGSLDLKGEIFGGAMGADDQKRLPNTPCADDATARSQPGRSSYPQSGTGVTIILGGNSDFRVQSGASVELFTRDSPETGTTPGVTIWARRDRQGVTAPSSTYNPRQAGEVVHLEHKQSNVVLHGLTYVPDLDVVLNKEPLNRDAGGASMFSGGVLAKLLFVRAEGNNGATPGTVTLAGGGGTIHTYYTPRTTLLQATATSSDGGTNTVTAVVDRTSDPPRIVSWRQG